MSLTIARHVFSSVLMSCLVICLGRTPLSASEEAPIADVHVDRALGAHLTFLADDLLEGRGTGTTGHEIAARYVASQFAQLGLQSGTGSNTWFQTVPLIEGRLLAEQSHLELSSDTETNVLEYNLDYLAAPNLVETNVTIHAPLFFVGYGVQASDRNYDDFADVDLRGKIAVVLSKAPPQFPVTVLAHHAHLRQKLGQLVARGAIGMITLPIPKDLEESPWPKRINQARFPAMRWLQADGRPADVFPQVKAVITMSPRGAGKFFARAPKALPEILAAAARGERQAFALNLNATISTRSEHRRLASPNVIARLPGSDPSAAQEAIIFTAHLDHQGRGPAIKGDAIYNGAYDNAIGIAMMIEAARLLTHQKPRRSVVFAAVTAEEKGLVGSDFLANHWPAPLGRPVANLNMDMVLVSEPTRSYTILGMEHSTLRGAVEGAAAKFEIELKPDPDPERVTFIRSDQYSFIRRGVPAIFPKVFSLPNREPVAGWISPQTFLQQHYHQPSDDLSLPRDSASSVRFVRFITEIAQRIAAADEAPHWNAGDFFGKMFNPAL